MSSKSNSESKTYRQKQKSNTDSASSASSVSAPHPLMRFNAPPVKMNEPIKTGFVEYDGTVPKPVKQRVVEMIRDHSNYLNIVKEFKEFRNAGRTFVKYLQKYKNFKVLAAAAAGSSQKSKKKNEVLVEHSNAQSIVPFFEQKNGQPYVDEQMLLEGMIVNNSAHPGSSSVRYFYYKPNKRDISCNEMEKAMKEMEQFLEKVKLLKKVQASDFHHLGAIAKIQKKLESYQTKMNDITRRVFAYCKVEHEGKIYLIYGGWSSNELNKSSAGINDDDEQEDAYDFVSRQPEYYRERAKQIAFGRLGARPLVLCLSRDCPDSELITILSKHIFDQSCRSAPVSHQLKKDIKMSKLLKKENHDNNDNNNNVDHIANLLTSE